MPNHVIPFHSQLLAATPAGECLTESGRIMFAAPTLRAVTRVMGLTKLILAVPANVRI